jgi:integrase/recombinase XerD
MKFNPLLTAFLEERESLGYRDIRSKKKDITRLLAYLQENNYRPEEIGFKEAQNYQSWLIKAGNYSTGTIVNFIKGAVVFYDYLKKKNLVYSNPFMEIKRIRVEKRLPKNILKEKEMITLLRKMANYEEEKGLRNQKTKYKLHVITELMYSTGLRISEIAGLKERDIDFERGLITVLDVKSRDEKIVFLNDYAREILMIYVKEMRPLFLKVNNDGDYLFGTGTGILIAILNRELKKTAEALGFPGMTSHDFRHAVGYHFLKRGCDIRYIQEILGHRNIRNTEIYTKVDKEDLKKVLNKYHPRKWREKI